MSYIIQGDSVVFENNHGKKDITLSHSEKGYELNFGSEVKFFLTSTHTTVRLGKFDITLSSDGESLEFKKDGATKFLISD